MRKPRPTRVVGSTVAAAAAVVGFGALAPLPASAATTDGAAYLSVLNVERAGQGLRPLAERADLDAVAQSWAQHMADTTTLSHNPDLATAVQGWQVVGENVGEGPTIDALAAAFWASPHHRDNILDPSYTDVGIGTVTRDGTIWITVDFRAPQQERATTAARPARSAHRVLHVGMRGRDVARVQRRLHVGADGIFGPVTRRAVARFQHRHHLHASGVVGRATWRLLAR
jgi:murein L,D-transpeptidase YcbB/YkuD